jgi:hypothetical protein
MQQQMSEYVILRVYFVYSQSLLNEGSHYEILLIQTFITKRMPLAHHLNANLVV